MWPSRSAAFLAVVLTLAACNAPPRSTAANLARVSRMADLQSVLPPAPAQLAVYNQNIRSSKPSPIVLRNLQLNRVPVAAFLFGNTTREQIEATIVRNFSANFSQAQPRKDTASSPQMLSAGDDSEISGFLSYQDNTMILASRGYRGTSLVGLPIDIDDNPNTNNRSQRLFWFPEGYQGSGSLHYDGLHLLVIFASNAYPNGLALMRANERIGDRGPVKRLPFGSYQIINVQGQLTLTN